MADASTHELVGCEVTLKGLNAKPELNGRLGKVKAWLPDRGRLQVKLLDDDGVEDRREAPLAVKPDNVEKVDIADKFRNGEWLGGRPSEPYRDQRIPPPPTSSPQLSFSDWYLHEPDHAW